jgi:hypothetical protein
MKILVARTIFTLIILSSVFAASTYSQESEKGDSWKKIQAIKGIPFCAIILGNNPEGFWKSREIYVLMEQAEITENNLRILFQSISDSNPEPPDLSVTVYTDIKQLKPLVLDGCISGGGSKVLHGAYYNRRKNVELFRYNPNFPEPGLQTVTLKGKE